MKKDKELRRLKHLCYINNPPFLNYMWYEWDKYHSDPLPTRSELLKKPYYDKEYKELLTLSIKLFDNENDAFKYWFNVIEERQENRKKYNLKPIESKQDNKNKRVGSGNSWRNKIRYPKKCKKHTKKCRKNAWKRFYKLFPHIKESHDAIALAKENKK